MGDPLVGLTPALIEERDIKAGVAVRSPSWADMGGLSNHLLGRGRCLVPPTRVMTDTGYAGGTEYVFRFRCKTSAQAVRREWVFTFDALVVNGVDGAAVDASQSADTTYLIEVPNGATAVTHVAPAGALSTRTVYEDLASQAAADTELTFAITPTAVDTNGVAVSVACYEVPRYDLVVDATDWGVDTSRARVAQPVALAALESLVPNAATTATLGKRGGFFHWAVPATAGGATVTTFAPSSTSSTHVPIFAWNDSAVRTAIGIPVLARKLFRTSTTGTLRGRVLGWTSVGTTTLSVRFTTSRSGTTTAAQTTASTTPTWLTAIDITVDCEDLTTANGLRGPDTFDYLNLEFARSAGAGTVYVAACSIWED